MTLRVFSSGKLDFKVNERRMYNRLLGVLREQLDELEETYYLVVDHAFGNNQIDLLLIKKEAVACIDMKAYSGKITGSENGDWSCEEDGVVKDIKRRKNPFQQCKSQRFAVMRHLGGKLPLVDPRFKEQDIAHIGSGVCFMSGSSFDEGQIDDPSLPWFFVTNEDEIADYLMETDSHQFVLKDWEIMGLLELMNLKEIDPTPDENVEIDTRNTLSAEDTGSITAIIAEKFDNSPFTLKDLEKIADSESAVRYLMDNLGAGVNKTKDAEGKPLYSLDVGALPEPEEEPEEDEDTLFIRSITGDGFSLKPTKKAVAGKEYTGVYRGAIYHFNYQGKFWFNAGRGNRIPLKLGDSKIVKALLEIKPLGGSFRITESNEVLVKIFFDDEGYREVFVGMFKGQISYEDLDWDPKGLKKGDLWPAPYTGTVLSVNSNRDIGIRISTGADFGVQKVMATGGHEELASMVLSLKGKGDGGRFLITENRHVITLLEKIPYPLRIRKQLDSLSKEAKNIINFRQQTGGNKMVPVYIGKAKKGNITFNPPFDLKKEWSDDDIDDFIRSFS